MQLMCEDPVPRRFQLVRLQDLSGISGTGIVASGCEFPDGHVAMRWNTEIPSTAVYDSLDAVVKIHGHDGASEIVWLDYTNEHAPSFANARDHAGS